MLEPHQGRTELIARAVIAAAKAYGDDPLKAVAGTGRYERRALTAAVSGLDRAGVPDWRRTARSLGMTVQAVISARTRAQPHFIAAEKAARRAARYAQWRPEAAAAVVAAAQVVASEAEGANGVHLRMTPGERVDIAPKPPLRPILRLDIPSATEFAPSTPSGPTLTARILGTLAEGPRAPQTLATLLDAKEALVGQSLRVLLHGGQVVAEPLTDKGLRGQMWRLP